jgi:glucose dehydrogenase
VKPRRRVVLVLLIPALVGLTLVAAACAGQAAATTTQPVSVTQAVTTATQAVTTTKQAVTTNKAAGETLAAMFRANPERTGAYPSGGPSELHGLVWKFETGDVVWSSPAITDGVVYVGSDDHYLYAVDIQSGQEKWKFQTGGTVRSSPAVSEGVVYFGSADGYLYAVK